MTSPRPAVLLTRRRALADGVTDAELTRAVRRGEAARLRRGAYLLGQRPGSTARHRLLVQATVAGLRLPAVVSHQSAAVLHGFPTWSVDLRRVHVTRTPPAWDDATPTLRCHVARLPAEDVVLVDGMAVTSPARTAVDLARSLPFEPAVVALDGALAARTVTPEALRGALAAVTGIPGSRAAARAVAFADGRSESVGESRSRVVLHRAGLAPTALQYEVRDGDGVVIARTDVAWEDRAVVGEFDGQVKYGRLLRPGQAPGDVVFAEKRREDRIRDQGFGVVRWVWDELGHPDALGARVRRALERRRYR